MKFGGTFNEYLQEKQEKSLTKCSYVEYKRLKKVLKACRVYRATHGCSRKPQEQSSELSEICRCQTCAYCDQIFFSELAKEASEIAGWFSSRVRRLVHPHCSSGLWSHMRCLPHCFIGEQTVLFKEGKMLIDYVTANAIAIQKILKKYDKIHGSVNGKNFNIKMRKEHLELLHSPWLIELGAFYMNFLGSEVGESGEFFKQLSCDLSDGQSVLTLALSNTAKLEYNLTCAICLETIFNPYALRCGHLFCKECAWSAASMRLFESIKAAAPESRCPVCREVGVYTNSIHMSKLGQLLRNRLPDYWRERREAERAQLLKQTKEFWDLQKNYFIGY